MSMNDDLTMPAENPPLNILAIFGSEFFNAGRMKGLSGYTTGIFADKGTHLPPGGLRGSAYLTSSLTHLSFFLCHTWR